MTLGERKNPYYCDIPGHSVITDADLLLLIPYPCIGESDFDRGAHKSCCPELL